MKCPKCGYLGYERVERCRNCGYEFALTAPPAAPDLRIRESSPVPSPLEDIELLDSSSRDRARMVRVGAGAAYEPENGTNGLTELPLFGAPITDDVPLITTPSRPRPPLAVRRATPELPRVRSDMRTPLLEWPAEAGSSAASGPLAAHASVPMDLPHNEERPIEERARRHSVRAGSVRAAAAHAATSLMPASLGARGLAIAIDLSVLAAINLVVIYFTLKICGIATSDWAMVPKAPLLAFLLVQNGGYLVVFTAAGQTIGKLVAGIRVLSDDADVPPDVGRAALRTALWLALALPAGLGLLTVALGRDGRGLHDRVAGTRVVRSGV